MGEKACCSLTRLTTNMRNTAGIRSSFQVSVLCFFALALCAGALSHESKTEESHAPPATVKSPVEADDQSPEALVDSDLDEDDEDADDDEDTSLVEDKHHSKVHVGHSHITIGRGPNAMKIKLHGHGGRSHSHHARKMSHVRHTGGHRVLGQGRRVSHRHFTHRHGSSGSWGPRGYGNHGGYGNRMYGGGMGGSVAGMYYPGMGGVVLKPFFPKKEQLGEPDMASLPNGAIESEPKYEEAQADYQDSLKGLQRTLSRIQGYGGGMGMMGMGGMGMGMGGMMGGGFGGYGRPMMPFHHGGYGHPMYGGGYGHPMGGYGGYGYGMQRGGFGRQYRL